MNEQSAQSKLNDANLAMLKEMHIQLQMQQALILLLITDLGGKGMLSTSLLPAFRNSIPAGVAPDERARLSELFNGTADSLEALIEKAKGTLQRA